MRNPVLSRAVVTTRAVRRTIGLLAFGAAALSAPLGAQSLPGLENYSIDQTRPPTPVPSATPSSSPSASPSARPTTSPSATPVPTPSAPTGLPRVTPTPRATASSTPSPTPSATADRNARPEPTPSASATQSTNAPTASTPAATPTVAAPPASVTGDDGAGGWPWRWIAAIAVLAGAGLGGGWLFARRRRAADAAVWAEPVAAPPAAPPPPAAPSATPPPPTSGTVAAKLPGGLITPRGAGSRGPGIAPAADPSSAPSPLAAPRPGGLVTTSLRPEIVLALHPARAAIDSLRLSLDYALNLRNAGQAPALAVSVESWLFGAGTDPKADLDRLATLPADETQITPFDLLPGAAIDLDGQGQVPREGLAVLTAGERRLVVPMLGVRVRYADRRGQVRSIVAAFLVGEERVGQDRLAPLALDRGARAFARLSARRLDP